MAQEACGVKAGWGEEGGRKARGETLQREGRGMKGETSSAVHMVDGEEGRSSWLRMVSWR